MAARCGEHRAASAIYPLGTALTIYHALCIAIMVGEFGVTVVAAVRKGRAAWPDRGQSEQECATIESPPTKRKETP